MKTEPLSQFRLTPDEAMILASMQAYLMHRDIRAEDSSSKRERKQRLYDDFVRQGREIIAAQSGGEPASWDPMLLRGRDWSDYLARCLKQQDSEDRLADAAPMLAEHVTAWSRGMTLLIELYAFEPWGSEGLKWNPKTRRRSILNLIEDTKCLTASDYENVDREFRKNIHRQRRKSVNWLKVGGFAAAGVVLGLLTAGLAAPVVGAFIGGAMGLSGAAATSAGLALLGGGSLAAGGLGMAGGTALIAGVGGVVGGTVGGGGAKKLGLSGRTIFAEAVKLDVLVNLVIKQSDRADEQARFVVMALEERLRAVEEKLGQLAQKLNEVSSDNKRLREELRQQQREYLLARNQLRVTIDDAKMAA